MIACSFFHLNVIILKRRGTPISENAKLEWSEIDVSNTYLLQWTMQKSN